ncbi:MAG: phosphotransferase [Oscillospiraceae bacterium]|nr:phosphotransferase [Oscillospiraceae bacterium]
MDAALICRQYTDHEILSVTAFGGGHINDTFLAVTDGGRYVLQRLQPRMYVDALVYGYRLWSKVFCENGWLCPIWLTDKDGGYIYTDPDGDRWRMYPFIDGDILSSPLTRDELYACGQGIARIHMMLGSLDERPQAVYPRLHDLGWYYDRYQQILCSGRICEENRDRDIEGYIRSCIHRHLAYVPSSVAVVHGDMKLANMLFRDGRMVGSLDHDTVMPGSRAEDVADCIRSCCISDGMPDLPSAKALLKGYTDTASHDAADEVMREISAAFGKICFELALRYYTDAISQEGHFKESYPGCRLERARALITVCDHIKRGSV